MKQVPPHDESQTEPEQLHRQKQPMLLLQRYKRSTLKTKLSLWSAFTLVLLLLVLGVSLLTSGWPFRVPIRNAGVHIAATAVYYVSPSGDDANNGSITHPFGSIQRAADVAQVGTIIHVLPGIYTAPVTNWAKGTAQSRITFISDVPWGAKIITSHIRTSWTNYGDFVDIQGFDITGDGDIGINNYASYVHIIGNHVHNYAVASCGIYGAAGIDDSENNGNHDNDVIGNVVDHIGPPLTTFCNLDQGIYHSTLGGHVANNIVYDIAAFGIHMWHWASGVTIANNLIFNCGRGGIIVAADQTLADNFLVVNNISIHNRQLGIYEYGQTGLHNRFLNNLVYDNPINLLLQHGNTAPGTLMVDPRLVNYRSDGNGDYRLRAGSPAIGTGTSIGMPSTDINGVARATGKPIDRGPYVYTGQRSKPLVHSPPRGTRKGYPHHGRTSFAHSPPRGTRKGYPHHGRTSFAGPFVLSS
ncbi:MAG: hypothetical protein NVSMB27_20910 [Ktedonobacteraceae bacterium]